MASGATNDSGVVFISFAGPFGAQGLLVPILSLPLPPARLIDFAGLVGGRWRHPFVLDMAADGSGFIARFGLGNIPTRIRFGDARFVYNNTIGGRWTEFSLPRPFGSTGLPFDVRTVPGSVWWPVVV